MEATTTSDRQPFLPSSRAVAQRYDPESAVGGDNDHPPISSRRRPSLTRNASICIGLVALLCTAFILIIVYMRRDHTSSPADTVPALARGGNIRFISPAGPISGLFPNISAYPAHVALLAAQVNATSSLGAHALDEFGGYLAGTDEDRAADVMAAFRDDSVSAIIANRGGWGCNRIIDMLDYETIRQHPKPIMGFSDLTGLLNAIHTRTGLVTFHGQMGYADWSPTDLHYISGVLSARKEMVFHNAAEYAANLTTIRGGKAKGRLIGGNLSVFTAMIGSAYLPSVADFRGRILFVEDVEEYTYEIDRMLTQLHLAGILAEISGFIFGMCTDCPTDGGLTVNQLLMEKVYPLGIPAYSGAMFGHDLDAQFTLPIGGLVEMDADAHTIRMLDAVVHDPPQRRITAVI